MENNLQLIDDYFMNLMTEDEKRSFEKNITLNETLAKDVAFYLQAKQLSSIEKKQNFADLHQSLSKPEAKIISFKSLKIFSAAASILLIFAFVFLFNKEDETIQYANNYVDNQLITIDTEMSSSKTGLMKAIEFYNQKQYNEALQAFDKLPVNVQILEYKGLTFLQTKNYASAQKSFHQLAKDSTILQNKGAFYEAITLLKMKKEDEAKTILKTIVESENNYFGKNEAKELLLLF